MLEVGKFGPSCMGIVFSSQHPSDIRYMQCMFAVSLHISDNRIVGSTPGGVKLIIPTTVSSWVTDRDLTIGYRNTDEETGLGNKVLEIACMSNREIMGSKQIQWFGRRTSMEVCRSLEVSLRSKAMGRRYKNFAPGVKCEL